MSYTSVQVDICDSCGKQSTTHRSTEDDKKHPDELSDSSIKYWHSVFSGDSHQLFCCWDCVRAYAEHQIATGRNRLEDDVAT